MNKVMICGLGVLFVVAVFIGGCGQSEEQEAEAPAAAVETVAQEAAPVVEEVAPVVEEAAAEGQEIVEDAAPVAESAMEKAEGMVDEAAEEMKELARTGLLALPLESHLEKAVP